ncbi:MAG: hypothetical protein LBI77_02775 [Puniceicoccales bacterium]|jgi:hypothetical protein|nr:hypothetical protein [Puniceicoccales bacterium]
MILIKKILSFLFFIHYNLYVFSAAVPVPLPAAVAAPVPILGPNVRMEAALNVPIAAIVGVPFANANLFDPATGAIVAPPAAGAPPIIHAGPLGAVPEQIFVHSDTVAVDKFISYCHNASLGDFDPVAAAAPVIIGPANAAVAAGLQINALINRLREFYSTDINDLTYLLSVIGGWTPNTLPHLSLAAVTVISKAVAPAGAVVLGLYDYRTFFFGDIFRSGGAALKPGAVANPFLPWSLFHAFEGGLIPFVAPAAAAAPPLMMAVGRPRQAHSEKAFASFLNPPVPPLVHPATPLDSHASLATHIPNTANIIAFIVHFKNKLPMCGMCKNGAIFSINAHFINLLLTVGTLAANIRYDQLLLKGCWFRASLIGPGFAIIHAANSVIPPNPMPLPAVLPGGIQQTVRIVFIVGSEFKNVDIFE